jgi:signal transduction histidine kinase
MSTGVELRNVSRRTGGGSATLSGAVEGRSVVTRLVPPSSWLTGRAFGLPEIGLAEIAFAALFSAYAVALTSGLVTSQPTHQGAGAASAVLLMTVPVLFARRWPVEAAAALAAGAALNWLVIGHMVRCGAALPAVFFVAFELGARAGRRDRVLGMAFLVVSLFCQSASDPRLAGPQVLILLVPVSAGFLIAGALLRSRNAVIAGLRARTAELRVQRQRNAELAVAADRARIGGELDDFLRDRVDRIAVTAEAGRVTLDSEPAATQAAFVTIQDTGRQTLSQMRAVVRGLRDGAPGEPQPVLAQLDRLLGEATAADARLTVTGDPRLLPPGVELSGYRIVEHLLLALEDDATARIEVTVAFAPNVLELKVAGPSAPVATARPALAAATERAALHGGTLRSQARDGRRETVVLLPLVAGRA